jgi:hypothetical protein
MPLDTMAALAEIDAALTRYEEVEQRYQEVIPSRDPAERTDYISAPHHVYSETITLLDETIRRWAPTPDYGSRALKSLRGEPGRESQHIRILAGILKSLRNDWAAGALRTFKERVQSDVFSDFLEMAEYLMEEGFAAPAAGLAGGVLEQHLRKLCAKHGVPVDARTTIDRMNMALTRADVYGLNEQHRVRAWAGTRNEAAHGNHDAYGPAHVWEMIQGVRHFISAYPA